MFMKYATENKVVPVSNMFPQNPFHRSFISIEKERKHVATPSLYQAFIGRRAGRVSFSRSGAASRDFAQRLIRPDT
jgi:hypothetical protein